MKKTIIMALMAAVSVSASAQQKQTIEIPSWLSNVKLSGYGMTQYQYSGQKDAESNSFNIRMARISLEGRIAGDFYWKTQIQFNGNTSPSVPVREWWICLLNGRNMNTSR